MECGAHWDLSWQPTVRTRVAASIARISSGPGTLSAQAPEVDKIRTFYNHPDFVAANAARVLGAFAQLPERVRAHAHIAFTAHSIPQSLADQCDYVRQLTETCRLVAEAVGVDTGRWKLVYQSRSGRPSDPWLDPDICDHLRSLKQAGVECVVVHPVGFLSDHMEVLFDLDEEAQQVADEVGLQMVRSGTVGTHPRFVSMLCQLIDERLKDGAERLAVGEYGPNHDICPVDCCPAPVRPQRPT